MEGCAKIGCHRRSAPFWKLEQILPGPLYLRPGASREGNNGAEQTEEKKETINGGRVKTPHVPLLEMLFTRENSSILIHTNPAGSLSYLLLPLILLAKSKKKGSQLH